jgi:spore coat polysaccharide biosynthesis protein SpsF
MKTVIIVQARMTSTRLPGKILKKVLDRPLLDFQIERLKRVASADQIVIATTTNGTDDQVAGLCRELGVSCFRGPEEDVLARYYGAAKESGAEAIVRITADCPVIDPVISGAAIDFFLTNGHQYDYVRLDGYPRGLDTEVFPFAVLEECWKEAAAQPEREHVTPFIYNHPERYRIKRLLCPRAGSGYLPMSLRAERSNLSLENIQENDFSHHRWTVDTPEDFELIRRIIEELYPTKPEFDMADILTVLEKYPEWKAINAQVRQKAYGE